MTHKCLEHYSDARKDADAFDELLDEFDDIKKSKDEIAAMELSDESKQLCFRDLDKKITELKERMHNAIDAM